VSYILGKSWHTATRKHPTLHHIKMPLSGVLINDWFDRRDWFEPNTCAHPYAHSFNWPSVSLTPFSA
jgi:hypothetical protein